MPERDRWYVGLIWLAACGFAADWSGLHFMVGAFLSGAVLDSDLVRSEADGPVPQPYPACDHARVLPQHRPAHQLERSADSRSSARPPCFLVAVGRRQAGRHPLAGRILKWEKGEASIIGWLLQTKALIMIIFVNILLDKGIITSESLHGDCC